MCLQKITAHSISLYLSGFCLVYWSPYLARASWVRRKLAPSLRAAIWRPIYKDGDQYTNAKAINNTGNSELYFFVNTYKTACEQAMFSSMFSMK